MTAAPHTLIYTHGGGRLGNQIMRATHWIAWARTHEGQVDVVNFGLWPFAHLFAHWREHPGCMFPLRAGAPDRLARWRIAWPTALRNPLETHYRWQRAVHTAGRWWPGWQAITLDDVKGEQVDLGDPAFFARVAQSPVTMCCGWEYACWRLVAQQQAALRGYFEPAAEFARPAENFMAGLRARHDLVVGLLIRHSDYRTWDGGRFYFSTARYAEWLHQLVALHPGRRVAVVVASEERQDPSCFAGLPCHFATGTPNVGGHWFENWVELSLCDLVLSPPSTFSATAAFRGGVPLWPLATADQTLAVDQLLADGMIGAARHPLFARSVR